MTINHANPGAALALWALMAGMPSASGQVSYRLVAHLPNFVPTGLAEGSPGVFYTAGPGPALQGGSAISVTSGGLITTLAIWPGDYNVGSQSVVSGADGRLYSSVEYSSYPANVFSVASTPDSGIFYPGQNIDPSFTQNLPDTRLLGVGAVNGSYDVIASDLQGAVTPISDFPSTSRPLNVLYASDGNYYGIAEGLNGSAGYIFRLTPAGVLTVLYSFPADTVLYGGATPLLQASDGDLYGAVGDPELTGTSLVYRITLDGEYSQLYTFPEGASGPTAMIEASDGNLYGCTLESYVSLYGVLFRMTKSGQYTRIVPYGGGGCSMLQGSDGVIYGATYETIFALDAGLPVPRPWVQHFSPASGPPGTQVRLWGHNLLSSSVQFNGVPAASVVNSGPDYVWATVPQGATAGPITITTPGGTTTTQASFTPQ